MRELLRIRNARIFLLGDVVSTLGDSALWLAMAIWVKELTGSSAAAGLVFFAFGVGNLLALLGGAVLLLTLPELALVLACMVVAGLALPWLVVAAMTAIQRRTPSPLLGRVSGAFGLGLTVPQVISIGLGASLIAVVSYRVLLLVVAIVVTVAALYLVSRPESRHRPVKAEDQAPVAADGLEPAIATGGGPGAGAGAAGA